MLRRRVSPSLLPGRASAPHLLCRSLSSLLFRVGQEKRKDKTLLVKKSHSEGKYVPLDDFIRKQKGSLGKSEVVAIMLESSKRKIRISKLSILTSSLQTYPQQYDANALSVVACGLQLYNSSDKSALHMIAAICDRLESSAHNNATATSEDKLVKSKDLSPKFSSDECINVLFGLQRMSSRMPEVQRLLNILPKHTQALSSSDHISSKMISKGLFALQKMNSDDESVRKWLAYYQHFVLSCEEHFGEEALSRSLLGLQGCSSNHNEVRDIVAALIPLLRKKGCIKLEPRSIGACLLGLQRMSNHHDVVDGLLHILVDTILIGDIPSSQISYNAHTLSSVFLGLQQMSQLSISLRKFLVFLCQKIELCDPSDLGELALVNMFYGLQNLSSEASEVRQVLVVLTDKLNAWSSLSSDHQLSLRGVSSCLFGLKSMSPSHPEVLSAMRALRANLVCIQSHRKFSYTRLPSTTLSDNDKSNIINSKVVSLASGVFQNMESKNVEVRRLLKTLAAVWVVLGTNNKKGTKLHSRFIWDSQAIGNVMYNIRNMSNEHKEVQAIMRVLWDQGLKHYGLGSRLHNTGETLSPLSLCHILYGFKNMTTEHDCGNVNNILGVVANELELYLRTLESSCDDERKIVMSARQICVAMYGLQGCSDELGVVRRIFSLAGRVLMLCVDVDDYSADMLTVSNAVLGLQSSTNNNEEVRVALGALESYLRAINSSSSVCNFDKETVGAATGNFLYGLQGMTLKNSDSPPSVGELGALFEIFRDQLVMPYAARFSVDSTQRSLYGVASILSNCTSILPSGSLPLLDMTHELLIQLAYTLHIEFESSLPSNEAEQCILKLDKFRELIPLYQTLGLLKRSLDGLQCLESSIFMEMVIILNSIIQALKPHLPLSDAAYNISSATEKVYYNFLRDNIIAQQETSSIMWSVHLNEILDGFSSDILIRGRSSAARDLLINVEIDGPSHVFPRNMRFMKLRDLYLKDSLGVYVLRVDVQGQGYHGSKLDSSLKSLFEKVKLIITNAETPTT